MPIIIPREIPAFELLKNTFIIDTKRAQSQDIRPLEVLIINLMPTKIETENQLLSLLANTPLQLNITFLSTASYIGKNTPRSHLERFYVNFSEIKHRNFDGAIITGAPVEQMEFEEVAYWSELCEIMDFLKKHSTSSLYLCWGAMAGLYHFHKISKKQYEKKIFGVFSHEICADDFLLNGLSDLVFMPHSRYCGLDEREVANNINLKVLLKSEQAGITMLKDNKDVFILGHSEYDRNTLDGEYKRDLAKGLKIDMPLNYYENDDPNARPIQCWRSTASVIFSNWINYSVYQKTPFKL